MGGEGKRKGRGEREKEIGSKENRTGRMKGLGNGEGGVAKLKLGKIFIFPYLGKNFKTSFSYFSLPFFILLVSQVSHLFPFHHFPPLFLPFSAFFSLWGAQGARAHLAFS